MIAGRGVVAVRALLAAAVLLVLWGYVVWPQGETLGYVFGLGTGEGGPSLEPLLKTLGSPLHRAAIVNSVVLSVLSVLCAGVVGGGAAILHDRLRFPGRPLLLLAAVLPLALPPLVGVMAFGRLVGHGGLIPRWLGELTGESPTRFVLADWPGILIVHTYSFSVYFFVMTRAGLSQLDHAAELAARSLGASLWQRWRRVTLPSLLPHLVAAALLTFMVAMGSYSAPRYMTSGKPYLPILTVEIAYRYESGDATAAAVLASVLAAVCLAVLVAMRLSTGQGGARAGQGTKGEAGEMLARRPGRPVAAVLTAASILYLLLMALPLATIAMTALADTKAWNAAASILPPEYTLANFSGVFARRGAFMHPALVSLLAASASMLLNIAMALASAWIILRGARALRLLVDAGSMLPLALPGTVVAINLLLAYGSGRSLWTFGWSLRGTFTVLVLVYFVRQIPLALRPVSAAMARLSPQHEAAARSLGAGPALTFRRVVLPQLWPGIMAAGLICFVSGLGEFVASVLAQSTRWRPISIEIASALGDSEGAGPASAYAALLMALTIAALGLYQWLTRER